MSTRAGPVINIEDDDTDSEALLAASQEMISFATLSAEDTGVGTLSDSEPTVSINLNDTANLTSALPELQMNNDDQKPIIDKKTIEPNFHAIKQYGAAVEKRPSSAWLEEAARANSFVQSGRGSTIDEASDECEPITVKRTSIEIDEGNGKMKRYSSGAGRILLNKEMSFHHSVPSPYYRNSENFNKIKIN